MILWTILIALIVLLMFGVPVMFAIGASGMLYFFIKPGMIEVVSVYAQRFYSGMDSFVFLCIPMFVFAGEIMNGSGMMNDLVNFCKVLVGRARGGMAHVNVVASMLFGGITGSGLADVSCLGPLEIKAMEEDGYSRSFSAALTATSCIQGPIIPPSIPMVIFASLTNASVGALFLGGILPGVLIGLGQMFVIMMIAKKRGFPKNDEKLTVAEVVNVTKAAAAALMIPVILIGGIVSGFFTPTEAASVCAGYATIAAWLIYKNLSMSSLKRSLVNTVKISGSIYLIIGFVQTIGWVLAAEGVPHLISSFVIEHGFSVYTLVFLLNVFLLVNGCWLSDTAQLVLFAPIFTPILINMGLHPVHIGVIFVVNVMIGMITPPYGMALYLSAAIAREPLRNVVRETLPFTAVSIFVLFLVSYFPNFVLFIPRLLGMV